MMRAEVAMGVDDLFGAIAAGDEALAWSMVESDGKLAAARHPGGVGAILWALYHRRRGLAEKLARARGELDVFEAAALGDGVRLKALLAADPSLANAQAPDGFAPLGLAAFFGADDAAAILIAAGADLDRASANTMRVAPLHSAVSAHHPTIARRLLEAGASASPRQQGGWTPLHSAAHAGDRALVELLLAHDADPAARSDDGKTPHDMAAAAGHAALATMLPTPLK
jgi:ankyrin repeat protein